MQNVANEIKRQKFRQNLLKYEKNTWHTPNILITLRELMPFSPAAYLKDSNQEIQEILNQL